MKQLPAQQNVFLESHPATGTTMMDHLFARFDGAYPSRWEASFKTAESVNNWRSMWAESINDENITPSEFSAGISHCCKTFDWPPSLAQFLKACKQNRAISPEEKRARFMWEKSGLPMEEFVFIPQS